MELELFGNGYGKWKDMVPLLDLPEPQFFSFWMET